VPLALPLIDERIAPFAHRLHEVEARVFAARRAAQVIAALPEEQWYDLAYYVAERTGISLAVMPQEIITARETLRLGRVTPTAATRHQPSHRAQANPSPVAAPPLTANPAPTQRWEALARSIRADLTTDRHWPALARSIDRAAANGVAVDQLLSRLATNQPLPDDHPARSLDFRLIDAAGDTLRTVRGADLDAAPAAARRTAVHEQSAASRACTSARPTTEPAGHTRPPAASPPAPKRPPAAPRR
jgi:hypothetical protein